MTYNRYEPKSGMNHAGLGAAIRRALTNEPKFIGPGTEGLAPGFHKQTDGKLMYVPDMAVIDKPPAVKRVKRYTGCAPMLDIHDDATRPAGFYDIVNSDGSEFIRHWHEGTWFMTGDNPGCQTPRGKEQGLKGLDPCTERDRECSVLRARPDLDDPVYDEPEGDEPATEDPIDPQCDATRPSGFYEVTGDDGSVYLRHWSAAAQKWATSGVHTEDLADPYSVRKGLLMVKMRHDTPSRNTVLRARKDLDAMVAK